MLYVVTFDDDYSIEFEVKDLADLFYYLQTGFLREDHHDYTLDDIVKIEQSNY